MTTHDNAGAFTGTISNVPRRRSAHRHLFFLEVSVVDQDGPPRQVLLKHGRGGSYASAVELEELRRNARQGDSIRVQWAGIETTDDGTVLWHAKQARLLRVRIHGNTGSSYEKRFKQEVEEHAGSGSIRDEIPIQTAGDEQEEIRENDEHLPSKKERFAVFCDFLKTSFSVDSHIYDIAGGRGELSLLLTLAGFQVTLVDPRENAGMLSSRSRKQLRKSGKPRFAVERVFFDPQGTLLANHADFPPLLVGLHPDEATEAIVDAALAHCYPFAVVPCCVFSRLFPHRRHQGKPVRTHDQFCRYLQSKARGIQSVRLNFGGHATVLYHLGDYGVREHPAISGATTLGGGHQYTLG